MTVTPVVLWIVVDNFPVWVHRRHGVGAMGTAPPDTGWSVSDAPRSGAAHPVAPPAMAPGHRGVGTVRENCTCSANGWDRPVPVIANAVRKPARCMIANCSRAC